MELLELITEASSALAKLDAVSLEELGRRAEALVGLNLGTVGIGDHALLLLLRARFRGFAAILKATGENLATLQRAEDQGRFGAEARGFGGGLNAEGYQGPARGLFESFGLYDDAAGTASIWPRAKSSGERA